MKRLIEKGLMFGNLVEVTSPALIERYNRALEHLTGKRTTLTDFHIDISGYSPEIGDELGDDRYLNPNGCNRQFIILTTAQKTAPLLNVTFSTSRGILRQFMEANDAQLFALTARDAVAGELSNSVYEVATPARLLDIRRVTVEADTIGGHVADAGKLATLIDRFRNEPAGWRDDVLIADMIGLAKRTGDVTRVPIALPKMTFEQPNFWTAHFGGLYVFRGCKTPAVIATTPADLGDVGLVITLSQRNKIADWLDKNGLVEPIVTARGMDSAGMLRQKMDFILVDVADALALDLGNATRNDLRKIAQRMGAGLPEAFLGLARLLAWVEGGGDWPRITSEHPAYFYTLRARPHADRDLVNMLLSQLAPLDVRQMYITHKELFYASYATWSDRKRGYVAEFLAREYQVDKAGARAALFGAEPGMDEAAQTARRHDPKPAPKMVDLVGPWGSVRKARR
ncbi:hypothetical protein SAMN05216227_1001157 [Pseudorhodobacter antarcticus]|uniref:Uncharacterized protein n=1 Tax=Pseudorhodobacter antarcticus TaxID=1077947 RepID=A0A1H8AJF5_9RHOB|nr:DUF6638 family protein [Pseudorhodobacter antarcticus]SEM70636.1 hypothetical protein SAMN05216227_1001157 [Pseudorhodobacter antarcticus]